MSTPSTPEKARVAVIHRPSILQSLIESQLRRIDLFWTRFEDTGDERWLRAAQDADRMYLRMKERAA